MTDFESFVRYSDLLRIYGNLLSKTQKEMLEDYYLCNLSFSEIAENRKISRSAVEDAIKKGKRKLDSFENEIGSLKIANDIHRISNDCGDKKTADELKDVERALKHGI